MFTDLLHSSYFSLFLIVALGFMLGRIKIKGLSLDVSAVIFIALLFGHFGVSHSQGTGELRIGTFYLYHRYPGGAGILRLVPQQGEDADHYYHADHLLGLSDCCRAQSTLFGIDTPSVVGLVAGALTSTPGLGRCHRQHQLSVGFHRLWYRLSVWGDWCHPVCEAAAAVSCVSTWTRRPVVCEIERRGQFPELANLHLSYHESRAYSAAA